MPVPESIGMETIGVLVVSRKIMSNVPGQVSASHSGKAGAPSSDNPSTNPSADLRYGSSMQEKNTTPLPGDSADGKQGFDEADQGSYAEANGSDGRSNETDVSFATRLVRLRAETGLSLRGLGREVGVTANAVLRWEKAEVTPTRAKMVELAQFFGVEPGWLAWGLGKRTARIDMAGLIGQLQHCSETQLNVISSMVDAFLSESRG